MLDRAELEALLGRVEIATGPDREIDSGIHEWQFGLGSAIEDFWPAFHSAPVTASVDAALALVARLLPGWGWSLFMHEAEANQPHPAAASLFKKGRGLFHSTPEFEFEANATTAPLAILAALLKALIANV